MAESAKETQTLAFADVPNLELGRNHDLVLLRLNFDGTDRSVAGRDMKGFRNFLSADGAARKFMIDGEDPLKDQATDTRVRQLMSRLAWRMETKYDWPPHSVDVKNAHPGIADWDNPEIPSGYTYLLQLVAHDLVASSFPLSLLEETTTGARNMRSTALRLDTIYGAGPAACPVVYAPDDIEDSTRTALRIGPTRSVAGEPVQLRDIPRMHSPDGSGLKRDGLPEVAIADPRNDDNAVLSQMTVLFHMLHNAILALLPPAQCKVMADSEQEAAYKRFLCARGAVTLIYRNIIRKDLLKRILHPAVYAHYQADRFYDPVFPGFDFLDKDAVSPAGDPRIPLEFSHAAFRFGHAMVRQVYRFNDRVEGQFEIVPVLTQNSAKSPTAMPFERKWIASWSHFFEIEGSKPNLSRRIGPQFSPGLSDKDIFGPIDSVEDDGKGGLAYRDLLGGCFLNLWSAQGLVDEIKIRNSELFGKSALLKDNRYLSEMKTYLAARSGGHYPTNSDVDALVQSTPLAFFVLFEAAADPDAPGLRLGLLGSIVVAEVILAAMARDPVVGEPGAADLATALKALSERTYAHNYLGELGEIASMPKLIKFVAKSRTKGEDDPAFV